MSLGLANIKIQQIQYFANYKTWNPPGLIWKKDQKMKMHLPC